MHVLELKTREIRLLKLEDVNNKDLPIIKVYISQK